MSGNQQMDISSRGAQAFSPDDEQPVAAALAEDYSEEAQKKLMERPSISVRLRIILGFLVIFVLSSATNLASLLLISRIQTTLLFLERADNFRFEIQQARRFEKNFFLYGTNLTDALEHIQVARDFLENDADNIRRVIKYTSYKEISEHAVQYQNLLLELLRRIDAEGAHPPAGGAIEAEVRGHGAELVTIARRLTDRERQAVDRMFVISKRIPLIFLVLVLGIMVYLATFFTRQILRPLTRFMNYTQRIAKGDFSPILPARKYKDEFSNLAIAFNQMLGELGKNQEQLIQSRKMAALGSLTSGIAHELNNPLNNVSITIESLLDDLDSLGKDAIKRLLEDAYTQTERASATVRNLLDFTRMGQPSFLPISVQELLEATIRLLRNEMDVQDIELEVRIPHDLPRVSGDFLQLQQVFVNLILNSIQAMERGGKLGLVARASDGRSIEIDVTDTGVGIPASHLPEIFDPFFTTKEMGKGTGLGLTVSYSIVKKHHGTISVRSQPNLGTTFTVSLPAHDAKG